MTTPSVTRFLWLLGLGLFFGLAFEEFHARAGQNRPGGVRSFPLLALAGALLYLLDPTRVVAFSAGLLLLGAWLVSYYWHRGGEPGAEGIPDASLMVPICNVLAYLLGPVAVAGPPWLAVGLTVTSVLLLTARERLHNLARGLNTEEIVTAGKFLLLTGFVLPLLPDKPVTALTDITPRQVWLAMLAVCTISYASYLLQRYVAPPGAKPLIAVLGGFYSSTATTIVLARNARAASTTTADRTTSIEAATGIILATAIMYLRLLIVIFVFNRALATAVAPALTGLALLGIIIGAGRWWMRAGTSQTTETPRQWPGNPLDLGAAAIFAVLFVAISIATSWAQTRFGAIGIYGLAGIVGITDIDPFVLSLAQHGTPQLSSSVEAGAIIVAASSNNLVKAFYAIAYSGGRVGMASVAILSALAAAGVITAALMIR